MIMIFVLAIEVPPYAVLFYGGFREIPMGDSTGLNEEFI